MINLSYEISPRGNLIVKADSEDRAELAELRDEKGTTFGSDQTMIDVFEHLIGNSELDWCSPEEVGALTDAPILCTRNGEDAIDNVWAFMSYQVTSPQDSLLDQGRAVFYAAPENKGNAALRITTESTPARKLADALLSSNGRTARAMSIK